jgi:hypothetical protein
MSSRQCEILVWHLLHCEKLALAGAALVQMGMHWDPETHNRTFGYQLQGQRLLKRLPNQPS